MSIQQLLFIDVPAVVPGSSTKNSGSGTFTVPLFNSLTVEVWGGGACAGRYLFDGVSFSAGFDGGDSSVSTLSLFAGGGKGSSDGKAAPSGGSASGGSTNTGGQAGGLGKLATTNPYSAANGGNSGGGAAGGTGGTIELPFFLPSYDITAKGNAGGSPGAGAGGNAYWDYTHSTKAISASGAGGGYCKRIYLASAGVVRYGDVLSYTVGAGASPEQPVYGNDGASGRVKFTWS